MTKTSNTVCLNPIFSMAFALACCLVAFAMPSSIQAEDDYITIDKQLGEFRVTRTKLTGGKQDGVELLEIDNGAIVLRMIPTRGMSILDVRDRQTGDKVFGWESPVKEVVHPKHINLDSRGGLGWLEGFNEWMVRCGLEYAGHPGKDEFVTNTGDTASMDLTLHGKIGNIPASRVTVAIDKKTATRPPRIRIRGVVYESFFYGPKLKLDAEVNMEWGSSEFTIFDRVTNMGASEQEFQLIYHMNFGQPILEEHARIRVAAKKIEPMNEHAAQSIAGYATYAKPTANFIEQVYLVHPFSDPSTRESTAVLHDSQGTKGAAITWNTKELPYLTIWKNTTAVEDGYVTGIEPATGFPFNRGVERKFGRVPILNAGESRTFTVKVGVLSDRSSVDLAVSQIQKIQAGRDTEISMNPPSVDAKN